MNNKIKMKKKKKKKIDVQLEIFKLQHLQDEELKKGSIYLGSIIK
jgi:hypothetical protein